MNKEEAREVEFYAASVNAWFNTKFERDKSLLTLSTGAIGLIITLISTIGVKSVDSLILYIFSLICFIVCLFSLLWIFSENAKHLEDVIQNKAVGSHLLKVLDRIALLTFIIGLFFIIINAIYPSIAMHKKDLIYLINNILLIFN